MAVIFPAAALLRGVRDGVTPARAQPAEAARTDPLTGLKNRLALEQEIDVEIERALRGGTALSIVIGDLDHFKAVNDELGHRAGDARARPRRRASSSRAAAPATRSRAPAARSSRCCCPNTSEHEAYLVAERMRAAVERDFAADPVPLTFSFGVATYPDHGRSADAVIEAADQALYAAKALGRNRSVIFNREISAIFAPDAGGRGVDETHLATLLSLAEALDLRDTGTAAHSRTVGRYCGLIAEELGLSPERVEARRGGRRAARHRQDRRARRDPPEARAAGPPRAGRDPHASRDRRAGAERARGSRTCAAGCSPTTSGPTARATRPASATRRSRWRRRSSPWRTPTRR